MTIFMTARFQIKPEAREQVAVAIADFIDYIRANEPRTLNYMSLQDKSDPTRFVHFFAFADTEAREKHSHSAGTQAFTAILYPECVAPVEFTEYVVVATT